MDCIPPGSSVHGIFQARILEWVAISYSRGTSPPRDRTPSLQVILYHCAAWEAQVIPYAEVLYAYFLFITCIKNYIKKLRINKV